jgi:hypothetical protein
MELVSGRRFQVSQFVRSIDHSQFAACDGEQVRREALWALPMEYLSRFSIFEASDQPAAPALPQQVSLADTAVNKDVS